MTKKGARRHCIVSQIEAVIYVAMIAAGAYGAAWLVHIAFVALGVA